MPPRSSVEGRSGAEAAGGMPKGRVLPSSARRIASVVPARLLSRLPSGVRPIGRGSDCCSESSRSPRSEEEERAEGEGEARKRAWRPRPDDASGAAATRCGMSTGGGGHVAMNGGMFGEVASSPTIRGLLAVG